MIGEKSRLREAVSDLPAAMKGYEAVKLADGIYAFISAQSKRRNRHWKFGRNHQR